MARDCTQLLKGKPALVPGADLLCLRTRLGFPGEAPDAAQTFGTALLAVAPTNIERRRVLAIPDTLLDGQCHVASLPEQWVEPLAHQLSQWNNASLALVVAISGTDEGSLRQLRLLMQRFVAVDKAPYIVVLVTDAPSAGKDISGLSGRVVATAGLVQTAAVVFRALAALTAPNTHTCLGEEDILEGFGPRGEGLFVADAVWFPRRNELIFSSAQDEDLVKSTDYAVLTFHNSWKDAREVVAKVREIQRAGSCLVYSAVHEFFMPDDSSQPQAISILCRFSGNSQQSNIDISGNR